MSSGTVHVIGALSPLFVFASNHDVRPFVGFSSEVPAFEANALEVARMLEMPIDYLLAPREPSRDQPRAGVAIPLRHTAGTMKRFGERRL